MRRRYLPALLVLSTVVTVLIPPATALAQPRYFISVDMEGIGGIGTGAMTSATGKDYQTGRELMTEEVNAVVAAILAVSPAGIVVNDSHGDMQNLLHERLDSRVEYIQGNIKPLGMVQDLDASFDGVFFIGYHAMAGTEDGFLAHTGSGTVKGLWINGREVGEGGLNALYAGSVGVPVLLAAGDAAFAAEFSALSPGTRVVTTKTAIGGQVARMPHPSVVREELAAATRAALVTREVKLPVPVAEPVTVRIRFDTTTRSDIMESVPGVRRFDGYTVEFDSPTMAEAYKLIRLGYKYISW